MISGRATTWAAFSCAAIRGRCARAGRVSDAHRDPGLVSTLESLLLTRFVEAAPARFEVFLERQRAAESAGYTVLA